MNAPAQNTANLRRWLRSYLLDSFLRHSQRFVDQEHGGFYEFLGQDSAAPGLASKRLLVQCRQTYVHSHASRLVELSQPSLDLAEHGYEFIDAHYWDKSRAGWIFKVEAAGAPEDPTLDLYAHAFVIFALAHYLQATGNLEAIDPIGRTLDTLATKFRSREFGGYVEAAGALPPNAGPRRQNPHMHLMEALLALLDATETLSREATGLDRDELLLLATDLYRLLREKFVCEDTGTLGEFFTEDWQPDPTNGHVVEPGHHFEWSWILHEYARVTGENDARRFGVELLEWGWENGYDSDHGGICDAVDRTGLVLRDSKRIWPQTECVKALAVHFEHTGDSSALERLVQMLAHLRASYLHEDGTWSEHLDRRGQRLSDRLPGSTGYHIFLGLSEALRVLDSIR